MLVQHRTTITLLQDVERSLTYMKHCLERDPNIISFVLTVFNIVERAHAKLTLRVSAMIYCLYLLRALRYRVSVQVEPVR